MKLKLIICLLFTICFLSETISQNIQNEPEKAFILHMNNGNIVEKFAKENKIKTVECFRDDSLSSLMHFNKNGVIIEEIDNENSIIRRSEYKFNNENKLIEESSFNIDGTFNYGYFYKMKNDSLFKYDKMDSSLFEVEFKIDKSTNVTIRYTKEKEIDYRVENTLNSKDEIIKEKFFDKYNLVYESYKVDDLKHVVELKYDDTGKLISKNRYIASRFDKKKNTIYYYKNTDELDYYEIINENGYVIKSNFGGVSQIYSYTSNGLIKQHINGNIIYNYYFDEKGFIKSVQKINGKKVEIFNYKLSYFE